MAKTILITGAGAGIGRATARHFLSLGWRVALMGRREAALLDTSAGAPALILPSLQVNIRAGDLPPEEGGRRYLRLPVNVLGA